MMTVEVSSSSSDEVERLVMLFVVICIAGRGRMEEGWVSDILRSVQIIRAVDKV
jgi:hypothetical protein